MVSFYNMTLIRSTVFTQPINTALWSCYSILIILGVLQNSLVVYLYVCSRIPTTKFNLCLVHLSLMNIGIHLGVLPLITVTNHWNFKYLDHFQASIICALTDGFYLVLANILLSALCLCLMSIMRYRVITNPLKGHLQKKSVKYILASFYVFGYGCSIPELFSFEWKPVRGYCEQTWHIAPSLVWFEVCWIILGFFTPVSVLLIVYCLTWKTMYFCNLKQHHQQQTQKDQQQNKKQQQKQVRKQCTDRVRQKYRRAVVTQLGVLIFVFCLCWIPILVYAILNQSFMFGDTLKEKYEEDLILQSVLIPCLMAGVVNPWCYAAFSKDFRMAFKTTITATKKSSSRRSDCAVARITT